MYCTCTVCRGCQLSHGERIMYYNLTTLWEPYYIVGTFERCGNLATLWEPYNLVGTLQPCGNLTTLWEPYNLVGTL